MLCMYESFSYLPSINCSQDFIDSLPLPIFIFYLFFNITSHNKLLELKKELEFEELMYNMTDMGGNMT